MPGAVVEAERSSPLGLLSAVRSPKIPFRHAPGLSLNNLIEPAAQIGVFTDGSSLSPITAFAGDLEPLAIWIHHRRPAHHLVDRPAVLVLGAGGGADVLLALYHGAPRIDAVELNPQLVGLVRDRYADFAGQLYARPEVRVHVGEARGFVAASGDRETDPCRPRCVRRRGRRRGQPERELRLHVEASRPISSTWPGRLSRSPAG